MIVRAIVKTTLTVPIDGAWHKECTIDQIEKQVIIRANEIIKEALIKTDIKSSGEYVEKIVLGEKCIIHTKIIGKVE